MRYVEVWTEDLGHIIGVKEVDNNYELTINEAWCTQQFYKENKKRFHKKKRFDNAQVQSYLLMKNRGAATEEIVKIIKQNYIIKTIRSDEKPEVWVYKDGIYEPDGKTIIKEICRDILGLAHTTHLTNDVINKIEADTYINEEDFFNEQNKYPYLIPVKNGLLDTKKKELLPFNHEIPFFNKINAEYQQGKDCPVIKSFLQEITGSEEDVNLIQEILGFCLIRDYKYEKAFMFYGSHGRNGKSKLLELMTRFLGKSNISGVSLQDIENDDFAIGNLQNKLVNIAGDISNEAIKNTGRFKGITGRDTLSANRKFKTRVDFINYAKVIFACNELPPVYTLSDSFWLRWELIDFPYQFLPPKELNALTEEQRANTKVQDSNIISKISTQEELNGLLNFALDGLERLERNGDFSTTKTAKQIRVDWQRKSNSVAAFIEDNVEEAFDQEIYKSQFLKEYQAYCKKHRAKMMSEKVIKVTLKESLGVSDGRVSMGDGQVYVWRGIKWKK